MPNEDKVKALLSDLGRATLRGVRKCPKCGTFNGTRGLCCKNKSCDVVFKEAGEKRKLSTEACKLITGTTTQVFSVRVRDKGPDYRGFVQLPVLQAGLEESCLDEAALITHTAALCFVDTCQRSFDASILKCHEKTDPLTVTTCQHIQAALRCYTEAQPLALSNSVLTALRVNNEMKQSIWLLATESIGPLVQRVSKNIMAVKCKASPKHPLGYLHFSFFMSKLKDRVENKYFCSCAAFKGQVKHATSKEDPTFKKCVHFYACVCAFASDSKLSEEFAYYIGLDRPAGVHSVMIPGVDEQTRQLVAILSEDGSGSCEVEVKVLKDEAALLDASGLTVCEDGSISQLPMEVMTGDQVNLQIRRLDPDNLGFITELVSVKRKRDEHTNSLPTMQQDSAAGSKKPPGPKKGIIMVKKEPVDEMLASVSFVEWLGSVTERINQAMHYQFNGKPDPLVFHVPQAFFDCLRERISVGGKKKRLPNSTTGFVRKDAIPLGTFTKYTWQITNIIHVKHIFETPLMPLEITRSFVENRDGTFEPFTSCKEEGEAFRKTDGQPLLRPLELKTFLKVGNTAPDQVDPTPFLIEWIPDILPQSKIGELRLRFEFGHQRCDQPDKRHRDASMEVSITRVEH